ncbi:hypothetical protein LR48_Vigan01g266300 [Vigna angularis]|uniref:Secreted protein n=1 Tax=Phaseolus angularis TaxID=3914 RepID=A0A0L9TRQ6_PHAAN|nr:hypothetical protein LR48_Vigan01g266300 [Vigna angularis]
MLSLLFYLSCKLLYGFELESLASPNTVWFEDEPDGSWWACDIRALTRAGSDAGARGMVQGAQTRSGSWQLRVEGVHGRIEHTPE